MKTHYLVGFAALALAFAGCSKNEVLETEGSKTGNAISFSTYAKGSKGTAIDNTGLQTAGNFGVTAFLSTTGQDAAYMGALDKGAKIIYNTAWGYEVASDTRYWPDASTNLAFYGYTPFDNATRGDVAPAFGKTTGMVFDNYVVPTDVTKQEDFMWAYTSTNKATSGATGVTMNFHHALVRVNFKARVTTSTLKVDIQKDGITICNIKKKGKVTITSATAVAEWIAPTTVDGTPLNNIIVPSAEVSITYDNDPAIAVPVRSVDAQGVTNSVMLMPQTFDAWNPKGGTAATASNAGYLKVMCKISNTSTTPTIYYHGTAATFAAIYIPLSSTDNAATNPKPIWVANNNITYTLNFGGGYDDKGDPILTPITFTTAVTGWDTPAPDPILPMP